MCKSVLLLHIFALTPFAQLELLYTWALTPFAQLYFELTNSPSSWLGQPAE